MKYLLNIHPGVAGAEPAQQRTNWRRNHSGKPALHRYERRKMREFLRHTQPYLEAGAQEWG